MGRTIETKIVLSSTAMSAPFCALRQSSNQGNIYLNDADCGDPIALTREQARALAVELNYYADKGELNNANGK